MKKIKFILVNDGAAEPRGSAAEPRFNAALPRFKVQGSLTKVRATQGSMTKIKVQGGGDAVQGSLTKVRATRGSMTTGFAQFKVQSLRFKDVGNCLSRRSASSSPVPRLTTTS